MALKAFGLLACVLTLAAAAGEDAPPAAAAQGGRVLSGTLLQALDEWATLAIDDVVSSGKPLPEGVTKQGMKDQTLRSFQPLLMVTRDEEEKFAKGEFDDDKNRKRLEAQIAVFEKAGVSLPMFTTQSIAAYKKGELKGGKLELAVRMNMLPYMKLSDAQKQKQDAKEKE